MVLWLTGSLPQHSLLHVLANDRLLCCASSSPASCMFWRTTVCCLCVLIWYSTALLQCNGFKLRILSQPIKKLRTANLETSYCQFRNFVICLSQFRNFVICLSQFWNWKQSVCKMTQFSVNLENDQRICEFSAVWVRSQFDQAFCKMSDFTIWR